MSNINRGGQRSFRGGRASKRGGGGQARNATTSNAPAASSLTNSPSRNDGPPRGPRAAANKSVRGRGSFPAQQGDRANGTDVESQGKAKRESVRPAIPKPTDPTDYAARLEYLKAWKDYERETSAWGKPARLEDAITPVGTCLDMCDEYERVWRIFKDKDVQPSEKTNGEPDEARMVKKFKRSAAGQDHPVESDLRPPHILRKTVDYLFSELTKDNDSLSKHYGFIWDRTRAIRNDFSVQQVSKPQDVQDAVFCFENIVRFHLISYHLFAGADAGSRSPLYNAGQDREQLDKSLRSLFEYYNDHGRNNTFVNEAEFRAYGILFQSRKPAMSVEKISNSLPHHIVKHPLVQLAIEAYASSNQAYTSYENDMGVSSAITASQDWATYFLTILSERCPYLMACAAEFYFPNIRAMALAAIIRAYKQPKARTIPFEFADLKDALGADDTTAVDEILQSMGIEPETQADGTRYLDLVSVSGIPRAGDAQPPSQLIERKRKGRTVHAIINGMDCQAASNANEMDDTEQSMFVPETKIATNGPSQLFGASSTSSTPGQASPFTSSQPSASLFGSSTPASSGFQLGNSLFGSNNASSTPFGQPAFGTQSNAPGSSMGIFGSAAQGNSKEVDGASARKKSVSFGTDVQFGSTTPFVFGNGLNPGATPSSAPSLINFNAPSQAEKDKKAELARAQAAKLEEEQRTERTLEQQRLQEEQRRVARETEERTQRQREEAHRQAAHEKMQEAQRKAREEQERRRNQQMKDQAMTAQLQQQKDRTLDTVTLQLLTGDNGLINMLLEHISGDLFQRAEKQYAEEKDGVEADEYRAWSLMRKYGLRWRSKQQILSLKRRRREKKLRAQQAKEEEARINARRADFAGQLEDFRRSERGKRIHLLASHTSNDSMSSRPGSNKENDPPRFDASQARTHWERFRQIQNGEHVPEPDVPQASVEPGLDEGRASQFEASLLTNGLGHSAMEPPPESVDQSDIRREEELSSSHAFRSRTGLALDPSRPDLGLPYGERVDTTIGPYFQIKAMMAGSSQKSSRSIGHGRKRTHSDIRLDDDSTHIPKRWRSSETPSRDVSTEPPLLIPPPPPRVHDEPEEEEDDPLLASIRRANRLLAEGTSFFREGIRSLQNTPEATPQRELDVRRSVRASDSPSASLRVSKFLGRTAKAERERRRREE